MLLNLNLTQSHGAKGVYIKIYVDHRGTVGTGSSKHGWEAVYKPILIYVETIG